MQLLVLKQISNSSSFKSLNLVLSACIDLSGNLKEGMYVGFSGSAEGSTEMHLVGNWTIHTSELPQTRHRLHPRNVSVIMGPQNPPHSPFKPRNLTILGGLLIP
ncbi:hypothetical protein QQ045_015743 [Rhodiola kirilowii]